MPYYTWNQNQNFTDFTVLHKQKTASIYWRSALSNLVYPFFFIVVLFSLCNGLFSPIIGSARIGCRIYSWPTALIVKTIISPFWLCDTMSQTFSSGYASYLRLTKSTLRHRVVNFFVCFKIYLATSCRKVFFCQVSNEYFCMEPTLRHRVAKSQPDIQQKE